jgi:DMSO reductase family type II enzyme heme b subunit
MKTLISVFALLTILLSAPAYAAPGNADNGKKVYEKRCLMCHGEEGDGDGPGAERLNPPPRDFTEAGYKIKTTGADDPVPNDNDLYRMIKDGMPGTAMPGWSDILKEQEMWDLVHYLKIFAELEDEKPEEQLDYGTQVATSPESIAQGKKLFHDKERCSECHGEDGKGDAVKRLKDDAGARTWPRNLTKPWTFRASNKPKDIFTRITVGITGTQMPTFADEKSAKKLSIEERWHVANYVQSLAKTKRTVRAENTVVIAEKVEGALPTAPDDKAWEVAQPTTFAMVPQIIAKPRFFKMANDTITAQALYNDKEVAFLLEWDDRTKSIPGDEAAAKIADPEMAEDAVALQLPVKAPEGLEKPYFVAGDGAKPVNIWKWSAGTTNSPAKVKLANGQGLEKLETRDGKTAGLTAQGAYKNGTWRVVVKRSLATSETDSDIQFEEGRFTPISFAAWDGSNSEKARSYTLTTWYWLLLKPPTSAQPIISGIIVALLLFGLLGWWARNASAKRES